MHRPSGPLWMLMPRRCFLQSLRFPLQVADQEQGGGGQSRRQETKQRDEREARDGEG